MATDRDALFEHREKTFKFVKECADTLEGVDPDLLTFQEEYVYNPEVDYPLTLKLPFDIETPCWDNKDIYYNITNSRTEEMRYDTWLLSRRGLMRNTIVKMKSTGVESHKIGLHA